MTPKVPQDILSGIDWYIKTQNNKSSRTAKRQRKYIKITKLFVVAKPI
jgi:hypothetical protein